MSKVTASPYLTIDQVTVGDLLVEYKGNGAVGDLLGIVENINQKSVRLRTVTLDDSTLELHSVANNPPGSTFAIMDDSIYALRRFKHPISEIARYTSKERRSLTLTSKRLLKWSNTRYKFYNDRTLFPKFYPYDFWKNDESIKDAMKKSGGKVAELLDEDNRKKRELKVRIETYPLF